MHMSQHDAGALLALEDRPHAVPGAVSSGNALRRAAIKARRRWRRRQAIARICRAARPLASEAAEPKRWRAGSLRRGPMVRRLREPEAGARSAWRLSNVWRSAGLPRPPARAVVACEACVPPALRLVRQTARIDRSRRHACPRQTRDSSQTRGCAAPRATGCSCHTRRTSASDWKRIAHGIRSAGLAGAVLTPSAAGASRPCLVREER